METKSFPFELKSLDAETGVFEGYAAVYGNLDSQGDIIERGAFTKTIAERPRVPILVGHNPDVVVGVGELSDSEQGLRVKGRLTLEVQRAREAHALMKDGALDGLSIGYRAVKTSMQRGARMLKEVAVGEFSLTPFPANALARVTGVKALADVLDARELPDELKDRITDVIGDLQALVDQEPGAKGDTTRGGRAADLDAEPAIATRLRAINDELKEMNAR